MDHLVSRGFQSMIKETLKSGRKGQELVEFAIMLPLLLLVLIGVIDIGRIFHASITLANASRAGARYATSYGFDKGPPVALLESEIILRVKSEANNSGISLTDDDIDPHCLGSCVRGGPVVVTVEYVFDFLFSNIIGNAITLTHSTEMKIPK